MSLAANEAGTDVLTTEGGPAGLLLAIAVDQRCVSVRLIDLYADHPILRKELLWRAVTEDPGRADRGYRLGVEPSRTNPSSAGTFTVRVDGPSETMNLDIAWNNFAWIGQTMAEEAGVTEPYSMMVDIVSPAAVRQ